MYGCTQVLWRSPHFYLIHRLLHPWRLAWLPVDPGRSPLPYSTLLHCCVLSRLLYRWVHSVHHRSTNPTAWSGTSMHPVEASSLLSVQQQCLAPPAQ